MSATYNTVTIGSADYDVYADVATADEYLAAEAGATAWRAEADNDVKGRALVSATRLLDRQVWPGSKYEDEQPLSWPRSGTGLDDIEDDVVPQQIIDATCVLAMLIVAGVDVTGTASTGSGRVKRQQAGSVAIEYFGDVEFSSTRLPLQVHELVASLLAGAQTIVAGSLASGTDTCSRFTQGYDPAGPL